MTRANRIAVVAVENGLVAKFFRTHAEVRTIYSWETEWKPKVTQGMLMARLVDEENLQAV